MGAGFKLGGVYRINTSKQWLQGGKLEGTNFQKLNLNNERKLNDPITLNMERVGKSGYTEFLTYLLCVLTSFRGFKYRSSQDRCWQYDLGLVHLFLFVEELLSNVCLYILSAIQMFLLL